MMRVVRKFQEFLTCRQDQNSAGLMSVCSRTESSESREAADIGSEFMNRFPDFPKSPEASQALVDLMEENGMEVNVTNLGAAHLYAVKTGLYQPLTQDDINFQYQVMANGGRAPAQSYSRGPAPPAPPSYGAVDNRGPVLTEWEMPLDQLRKQILAAQESGSDMNRR